MIALIDGDIIAYSVAAACEGVYYGVEDRKEDFMHFFERKKEANAFCDMHGIDKLEIQKFKEPEPIANCLHSVKLLTESIIKECGATEYRIFLSGSGNFRLDVCPDYKAHRPEEKPVHLPKCREYLIDKWAAEVVDGMEADDMLGIEQTKDYDAAIFSSKSPKLEDCCGTVICTLDKDLDGIPGWHYNWRKHSKYWVEEEEAERHFWSQMLIGDNADNITGIYNVGVKRAANILKDSDNYECTVGLHYAIEFDDPEEMFTKNMKLLRILTKPL